MLFDRNRENRAKAFALRIGITHPRAHLRLHSPLALTVAIAARISLSGKIDGGFVNCRGMIALVIGIIPIPGRRFRLIGLVFYSGCGHDEAWSQS